MKGLKVLQYYAKRSIFQSRHLSLSLSAKSNQNVRIGFAGLVGNTPLVRLNSMSEETGCEILAKVESANGGGSVKDRAALFLIRDAENKGLLRPGGTVVEGTAGNTGIGLAHVCNALGYKCVIFMPNTQSKAARYADSIDNAVWTNQFDNTANKQAHIETTGPEIWSQTGGKVDAVVFGTGTGGTLAGVATYLKEMNHKIHTELADPQGSVLYNYIKHGKLERSEGSSIAEGIGQGRVTANLKDAPIDDAHVVMDTDAVRMTFRLLHEEGFFVGASTGLNVAGAVKHNIKLAITQYTDMSIAAYNTR
ncbi:hypothetical protein EB796_024456 [Bugula neritina]|uniref:Tryptophan synthase beta chain-like PALP domain-containing protein n=1 Tax=Bugula neritina TaxID=10212 RepID=A0A7J7IUM1_BUGNE|nr:hypothetical protein EB796_024456 [Bugula neritina]